MLLKDVGGKAAKPFQMLAFFSYLFAWEKIKNDLQSLECESGSSRCDTASQPSPGPQCALVVESMGTQHLPQEVPAWMLGVSVPSRGTGRTVLPRPVMANLLELSVMTDSSLQHVCHRFAATALDLFLPC